MTDPVSNRLTPAQAEYEHEQRVAFQGVINVLLSDLRAELQRRQVAEQKCRELIDQNLQLRDWIAELRGRRTA